MPWIASFLANRRLANADYHFDGVNDAIATVLELHELRDGRAAVGKADVDEVDAVDQLADVELDLAGLALHGADHAARHIVDADFGSFIEHEGHLFAGGIGIEADSRGFVFVGRSNELGRHLHIVDFP